MEPPSSGAPTPARSEGQLAESVGQKPKHAFLDAHALANDVPGGFLVCARKLGLS